jgi:hypothetical protein
MNARWRVGTVRPGALTPFSLGVVLILIVAGVTSAKAGQTYSAPYIGSYFVAASHFRIHGCNSTFAGTLGTPDFNNTSGVVHIGAKVGVYSCGSSPRTVSAWGRVNVSIAGPTFKVATSGIHTIKVTWVVRSTARAFATYLHGPGTVLYGAEWIIGVLLRDSKSGTEYQLTTNAVVANSNWAWAGNISGDDSQGWDYLNQSMKAVFTGSYSLVSGDVYVVRPWVVASVAASDSFGSGSALVLLDLSSASRGASLASVVVSWTARLPARAAKPTPRIPLTREKGPSGRDRLRAGLACSNFPTRRGLDVGRARSMTDRDERGDFGVSAP